MPRQYKCKHTEMEVCPLDDRYVQCANSACTDPDRARRYRDARDERLYEKHEMKLRAARAAKKAAAKKERRRAVETGGLFAGLVEPIKLDDKGKVMQ